MPLPAFEPLSSPLQPPLPMPPASAPTLRSVLRLAPPDTTGARLATRIEIVQAILGVADRVQVLHDSYAVQRQAHLLSGAELARVRTLALAMLCQLARDVAPRAQQRLEQCLFPEDTALDQPLPPRHVQQFLFPEDTAEAAGPESLPMPLPLPLPALLDRAVAQADRIRDFGPTDPAPLDDVHDTQPQTYFVSGGARHG